MVEPGSMEENEAMNKVIMDEAVREAEVKARKKALQDSGDEQLRFYQAAGLADTERNSTLISEHIRRNSGVYCAATVKSAVENCRPNLNWVKVAPPVVAAPAPPPAATLSDGSKQLPLGTTPARHHSIAQLRDLDGRERAAHGRGGWHGAKF